MMSDCFEISDDPDDDSYKFIENEECESRFDAETTFDKELRDLVWQAIKPPKDCKWVLYRFEYEPQESYLAYMSVSDEEAEKYEDELEYEPLLYFTKVKYDDLIDSFFGDFKVIEILDKIFL